MAPKFAKTYKALSALLTYPTAELQAAVPEIRRVLAGEGLLPAPTLGALDRLLDELATGDLFDLQERYVMLFDRSRSTSLHLFEHVHGESRDRGQAMVDLARHYEAKGFLVSANELPDFLPLFLEFLSQLDHQEAHDLLQQPLPIMEALEERLQRRRTAYVTVFQALVAIAGGKAQPAPLATTADDDPDDLEALDEAWEESAVTFGPGDWGQDESGCGKARMATRIRAAIRSVHDQTP